MKILMIGTDRTLFVPDSEARRRIGEYGSFVDELHVVVFALRSANLAPQKIAANVWIYPTNSLSRWLYVFDAVRIGKKNIHNSKFPIHNSVITAQDPFESGLAGRLVAGKFGLPLQLQIHTDFLSPYFRRESLLNRFRVCLAKFLLPKADCVRVVSERIKNSLLTLLPKRYTPNAISVLPIFVDVAAIAAAPVKTDLRRKYPQFDFIIVMISRLSREKNIPLAIDAFARVSEKNPKAGLVIAGDGPERETLQSKIKKMGLEKNVIMENRTDDAVSYFKTADCFLLASDYEGYGRTVIEAMAAGCPVVMTDVGVAGEIVRDDESGLVAPAGDGEKLAECLLKIMGDGKLRENLAVKAKEALGKLTKEEYLKKYRSLWENCGKEKAA